MDNFRGAILMTIAMFGFALEDMLIKLLSVQMPTWQIILLLGIGGAAAIGCFFYIKGERLLPSSAFEGIVLLRNLAEAIATLSFVTALSLIPLSTAAAILQASPLIVTVGAAVFLGESVGWRRWSVTSIGFVGVLMIVRPATDEFDAQSLFAVIGAIGLAARDLATRRVSRSTSSLHLSFLGFLTMIPTAAIMASIWTAPPVWPQGHAQFYILILVPLSILAYNSIVAAMRVGDVSFVTPFRYTRILFALLLGISVFQERPDAFTLIGAGIVVASGLFILWREQRLKSVTTP
ncbi:MAG: DMT family transporter [Aestuariivita sp.]|nr:DMT family transporter [Aestuariivita sp.]MCY4202440.1 DMT family transporter [Aestuariivita sp.]